MLLSELSWPFLLPIGHKWPESFVGSLGRDDRRLSVNTQNRTRGDSIRCLNNMVHHTITCLGLNAATHGLYCPCPDRWLVRFMQYQACM